jgi:hypothetical protein
MKEEQNHTWRGFTFTNEEAEYMFLYALAMDTRIITLDEIDRLIELEAKKKP